MYSARIALFMLVALVAIASSRPVNSNRRYRRSCKAPASSLAVSAVPSPSISASGSEASPSVVSANLPVQHSAKPTASASQDSGDDEPAPSSSKAASKPSSTGSSSSSGSSGSSGSTSSSSSVPGSKLLSALFPWSVPKQSWSTAAGASDAAALDDSTFDPSKMISEIAPVYESFAGKKTMKAHYPKGSYRLTKGPSDGGVSFYASGPDDVDLTTAKEATFGYSVYFPDDFDFNKGGKLPGLYGGDNADVAVSCSGGRRSTECHSERLMWRSDGAGELYTYLPMVSGWEANEKQCNVAPYSECNPTYGASVGRGSFKFARGAWTTVSQRVRLNDVGSNNGEMELVVNGKSVINVSGLKFRDSSAGKFRGLQVQSFFGGSDSSWASPQDQDVHFADFSVAITEEL